MAEATNSDLDHELAGDREIPGIAKKRSPLGMLIIVLGLLFLLFLVLPGLLKEEGHRTKDKVFNEPSVPPLAIPEIHVLPEPEEKPIKEKQPEVVYLERPPLENIETEQQRLAREKRERIEQRRRHAPVLVASAHHKALAHEGADNTQALIANKNNMASENEKYMQFIKDLRNGGSEEQAANKIKTFDTLLPSEKVGRVQATYIREQSYMMLQGKMITAVLETAIQSNLPGMVRAVISEPIYSADGSNLLFPQGSRAVGNYQGGVQAGQERIFVVWNRIITPTGVDIEINSPGTGSLGRSGHSGWIDHHFLERFGASVLLSVVGAVSANIAGRGVNNNQQTISQVGDNFNKSSEIALENSINIKPTLHKNHGESIKIFVARDVNFKAAILAGLVKK